MTPDPPPADPVEPALFNPSYEPPPPPGRSGATYAVARLLGRMGWRLNLALFLLTIGTTTLCGALNYGEGTVSPASLSAWIMAGLSYSLPVVFILGAHEMGHYLACRYYRVDATLPYFLPAPPPFMFGTLGAVIRMRPPMPGRRALFDIGIAGPIAGFVAAVPVLAYGIATARIEQVPRSVEGALVMYYGDPLLSKLLAWRSHGAIPGGSDIIMNGWLMAGWFGLLVTAMNLFPVGQLDGGHVTFAISPRLHRLLARFSIAGMIGLVSASFLAPVTNLWLAGVLLAVALWICWRRLPRIVAWIVGLGTAAGVAYCSSVGIFTAWLLWTGILILMGRRPHPPICGDDGRLGAFRVALALAALAIFVLSFIPFPLEVVAGGG